MKEKVTVKLNVKEYHTPKQFVTLEELKTLAGMFPRMTIFQLIEMIEEGTYK